MGSVRRPGRSLSVEHGQVFAPRLDADDFVAYPADGERAGAAGHALGCERLRKAWYGPDQRQSVARPHFTALDIGIRRPSPDERDGLVVAAQLDAIPQHPCWRTQAVSPRPLGHAVQLAVFGTMGQHARSRMIAVRSRSSAAGG